MHRVATCSRIFPLREWFRKVATLRLAVEVRVNLNGVVVVLRVALLRGQELRDWSVEASIDTGSSWGCLLTLDNIVIL